MRNNYNNVNQGTPREYPGYIGEEYYGYEDSSGCDTYPGYATTPQGQCQPPCQCPPGANMPRTFRWVVRNATGSLTVPVGSPVKFDITSGTDNITFNGSDTLTIMDPGVYVLEYFVVVEEASTSPSIFTISTNGYQIRRSMTNTTGGLLSLSLVLPIEEVTTVQLINNSLVPKVLVNPVSNGGTTRQSARLNVYRIQ